LFRPSRGEKFGKLRKVGRASSNAAERKTVVEETLLVEKREHGRFIFRGEKCHWIQMVPVFVGIHQLGLLSSETQMTKKARQLFRLIGRTSNPDSDKKPEDLQVGMLA